MSSTDQEYLPDPAQPVQLSRRTLVRGAGASLVGLSLVPLLAACGGSAATPTSPPGPTVTRGTAGGSATTPAAGGATAPAAGGGASPAAGGGGAYAAPTITSGSHSLKFLMWSHFVPAYDEYFDAFAKDWGTKNKVDVVVDHIPTNTIFSRSAAEVAANSGHDLTLLENGPDTFLFADKLNDLSKLANYLDTQYGGWLDIAKTAGQVKGAWKGIPDFYIPFPGLYRKDYFDEVGLQPFDKWEDLIAGGKKLKPKGHQIGFAISATGDSNSTLFAILWGHGASVTAKDGTTITINSPETKQAIEVVVNIYKEAMTPEVLSWDDASNNRLLASSVGSYILNPISAYRTAPPEIQEKTFISAPPAGPKSRLMRVPTRTWVNWTWSKEQATAEKFLFDYYEQWIKGFEASTGYDNPMLKAFEKKPMPILGSDPKLSVLQDLGQYAATDGYPGPPTAAASQVVNTYVIPNMFAKACSGSTPEQAIAFAEEQIKSIYEKNPAGL